MMAEDSFAHYNQRVQATLDREAIRAATLSVTTPAGRFGRDEAGQWRPLPFAGYTVTTPPLENESNDIATYARLADVQQILAQRLASSVCAPVPVTSLHLTVADLVFGPTYQERVAGTGEEALLGALREVWCEPPSGGAIPMEMRGLTVVASGFVAALAAAGDRDGYERLMAFRNAIYSHQALRGLGVKRERKFTGHVTLAYLEGALSDGDRRSLLETMATVNSQWSRRPLPLNVRRAEVRKFEDMGGYYREEDWPVYEFAQPGAHGTL